MKKEKLSHDDFITLCRENGISVNKITRNYVYIDGEVKQKKKVIGGLGHKLLSNSCLIGNLGDIDIYSDWVDGCTGRTLEEYIRSKMKIGCIKIIRANTGLGLKESKDIADANMGGWLIELSSDDE